MNNCSYVYLLSRGGINMSIDNKKKQAVTCKQVIIHDEIVKRVHDNMPEEDNLYDLAELFKVFGDSTRIKIIWALFESEMCVCDIAYLLNMTQSAISHQLRVLKSSRLVRYRKSGKSVYYSLDDSHIKHIFEIGMKHIMEG
ncbi:MAG: winged helix-turn-helix transcriptional regulator [Clostridiaceae bacterium]|nr:winged helix-turn-helix transcriptional regulator [Clostridiaceae bacterium]